MKIITLGTSHGDPTLTRFQSSTLLRVAEDVTYLIDAGAPANALMIRQSIAPNSLRAVFITHQHEDHIGGLPGIVKSVTKRPRPDGDPVSVFLPEESGIKGILTFMEATHRPWRSGIIDFKVLEAEKVCYRDEHITVSTISTSHLSYGEVNFPSYAFLIRYGSRRIIYTGDLRGDFSDFPMKPDDPECDLCICEITHYPFEKAIPILQEMPIKRIIFNHVAGRWHGAEGEKLFKELTAALPYPAYLAHDGDSFSI